MNTFHAKHRVEQQHNCGLNEAQLRFKRGATAVNASDERGSASFKTQTHYTLSLVYTVICRLHH